MSPRAGRPEEHRPDTAVLVVDVQRGLVVVGIQSEMCVAATARGAISRGFTVVLPRDGHATYDLPARGGDPAVPAAVVSRVAAWSLGDTIEEPSGVADVQF